LQRTLGLNGQPGGTIRYQLFHRCASATITGEQYRAVAALVLVHSFSEKRAGWEAYKSFVGLFGAQALPGDVQHLRSTSSIPLFSAWVSGDRSFLKS
jgi:hypothetical protein